MFWKRTLANHRTKTMDFTITSYLGGLVVTTEGPYGGHVRFLGLPVFLYHKQDHFGWFNHWVITLPFVFAIHRIDDKGGTLNTIDHKPAGWSISFAKLRLYLKYTKPETYK